VFDGPLEQPPRRHVPSLPDLPCYHLFCKPEIEESQAVGPDLFSVRERATGRPYWAATAEEMLEKAAGKGPDLATDIAAKYLQDIT